eukprot:TRINITY_DN603_c0_g1_i11.p1 TRINITY_DN603_c0_g1~~TRINITY_DN603_c0_g1_i11.p1  ORF type:complete len:113 (-),score=37.12 TRINITY_DN603_c0_g1_i11:23-361(-)
MCIRDRYQRRVHGEFMEGFLKGIREVKSIEDLLKCMKHSEEIIEKIKKAISLIRKFSIESILEGFSMLFEALYQLEEMLMPCLEGFDQFKNCLLYTSPSPRDLSTSRMPSSA